MDFYQAKDFFKKLYPDKLVTFTFDKSCVRFVETVWTDGLPNPFHHVHYCKVKVSVDGQADQYVPISPHTENCCLKELCSMISNITDFHLTPEQIDQMKKMPEDELKDNIAGLVQLTGVDEATIRAKLPS